MTDSESQARYASRQMANPGNYFEDSIELTSVASYWTSSFLDNMPDGYAYSDILPTVAASKYVSSGFMGVTVTNYFSFTGDDGLADRIYEDYSERLAELYVKHRVVGIGDWAKKTVGWGFRGQTFHLPGLEIGKGAMMGNHQGDRYKGENKVLRNMKVTLEGDGVPYQLDPYTGKVAQIAEYQTGAGGVTFTIDRMTGGSAMIYAVTPDEGAFSKVAGQKITNVEEKKPIDLSGQKWQLMIHSYGPDPASKDPGDSKVTDVDFGWQALGKWCDIQASGEQLDMLGVSDMKYVSGTGEYTITFTLPDNFGESDGAFIANSYGRDQVGALIVNGTELPTNNASDRVDAGTLLTVGQNTLTIRLHSTLYGRTYFEHSGYQDRGAVYGMGEGVLDQPVPGTYYNGLLGVSIIPYIAKATDDPDAIRDVPAIDSQTDSSTAPIYNLQDQRLGTPQRGVNIVGGKKIIVK